MGALANLRKKKVTDLTDLEMCVLIAHDPQTYDGYYVQASVAAEELSRLQAIEKAAREYYLGVGSIDALAKALGVEK